MDDAGTYTIVAENEKDKTEVKVNLAVNRKSRKRIIMT